MARRFVSGDTLTTAIGTAPTTRAGTIVTLVRPYDSAFNILTTNTDILTTRASTTAVGAQFLSSGKLYSNADFGSGGPSPNDKDTWYVLVSSKVSGTNTYTYSMAVVGSATWSHITSGTASDGSGADNIIFGTGPIIGTGKFEIAAAAMYSAALNNTQVEALGTTSMDTWLAAGPTSAWQFNQASTATAIVDLTGNGANQTAISGTAVTTDPVGWTYHSTTTPFSKVISERYRVFNAFAKVTSERYRVLNAWSGVTSERYRVLNAWSKVASESYRVFNAWSSVTSERYRVLNSWSGVTSERYRVLNAWTKVTSERYRVLNAWALVDQERYRVLNSWALVDQERYRVFNAWSKVLHDSWDVLGPSGTAFLLSIQERYRIGDVGTLPYNVIKVDRGSLPLQANRTSGAWIVDRG